MEEKQDWWKVGIQRRRPRSVKHGGYHRHGEETKGRWREVVMEWYEVGVKGGVG